MRSRCRNCGYRSSGLERCSRKFTPTRERDLLFVVDSAKDVARSVLVKAQRTARDAGTLTLVP